MNHTFKVLHLCFSKSWGGLEMYPVQLVPALARHGWEMQVATLTGSPIAQMLGGLGLKPLQFRSVHTALLNVHSILRYLRANDIRVVHANKSTDMRVAAMLVALDPSIRLFFTDHMGVTRPKKDWFHRWTYGKLQRLFSVSDATHARNIKAFPLPAQRISRLYLGIDLAPYQCVMSDQAKVAQRLSLGVPAAGPIIAIPGRINEGKGHIQWVQALDRLNRSRPDLAWHGLIIGKASGADALPGGFESRLIAEIKKYGLENRITFAGFRDDMASCLKAVDIVAIASHNEAFGLSVIEAMAAGCAVVGADSGAIPEMITPQTGRLAPVMGTDAWVRAFVELLDYPQQRLQMARNAKVFSHAHFGIDQHVRSLSAYYSGAC